MIRILVFILVIVAAALGLAWLADRPGTITIEWLGYHIETSAFVGAVALVVLVALLFLAFAVLRSVWTRPAAVAAHVKERRRQQGLEALSRGLVAIGVGDRTQAQRYASIAGRSLPREPLTALLRAQTAQLKGDRTAARRAFETMLDRPETELLGVRGLFLEAKRGNDEMAARALAEQAVKRDPKLAWSVNALFDLQARAGDWDGAMDTLAIARQNGHVETDVANRRRAVLLTAEARELEGSDPDKALRLTHEALRLAPSLVPAAELAGRLLASKGEVRAAQRLIVRTWKLSPHPDLAVAYAFAKPGLSPRDRLRRVEYLAGLTPNDVEGPIAVANAAIEAQEWQAARDALKPYVEDHPSARVCTLMARIEGGEGDKGREREWLARAVRAPRDRAWIADGYMSDRWLPVSPVTGVVDAFQWKAPVDALGRGDETMVIEERPPRDASAIAAAVETVPVVDVKPSDKDAPRQIESKSPDFIPMRAPDDPGVSASDSDDSPTSLERLRAAQIR
ncbi:MAG: heme biosynthesis HemY N-terminal domain-containing protein [Hyphomicrobiales bacterium]